MAVQTRQVFVSYRRNGGGDAARVVRDALVRRRLTVFMDVDLGSGHFKKAILAQIEQCTDFVVVLTPGSLDRCQDEGDWLRWEIGQAIALGKNIVPVFTDGFTEWPALPDELAALPNYQVLIYARNLHDASMDQLASWLRTPLSQRLKRALLSPAAVLLVLGLAVAAWDYLLPPGPVITLVKWLASDPAPGKAADFTQPFRVRFPDDGGRPETNGEVVITVNCGDGSAYRAAVGQDGEAAIENVPAALKNGEASVGLQSLDWRLPAGTNTLRLAGEKLTLTVERQDLVIQGQTVAQGGNAPLAGVAVSAAGVTNASDARGQFSLILPGREVKLPLTLSARKDGYQAASRIITNLAGARPLSLALAVKPAPTPGMFSQVFLLHGAGGTNDLPANLEAIAVLQFEGRSLREAVNEQGEASFENLPAASRDKDAKVSLIAREWQLAGGTNLVRMQGRRIALALERRDILIHGSVIATNSEAPLAGALVSIAGITNATDRRGRFSVSVPGRLAGGPLTLRATMVGYQPLSLLLAAPGEEQDIVLSPAAPVAKPAPPPPSATNQIVLQSVPTGATNGVSTHGSAKTASEYFYDTNIDYLMDGAREAKHRGRMKEADERSERAVTAYRAEAVKDFHRFGPALAIALLVRAELLPEPGNRAAAGQYEEAKAICVKLGSHPPSSLPLAIHFYNYALSLSGLNDPRQIQRKVDAFQQAITLYSNAIPAVPGEALAGLADAHQSLGLHYKEARDPATANTHYREALRLYEQLPPGQDTERILGVVRARSEFADLLKEQGSRELARSNYLAAVTACEALDARSRVLHRELIARLQSDYGTLLAGPPALDLAQARIAYEQAISLYRSLESDPGWTNRISYAYTLNSYAVLLGVLDGSSSASGVDQSYQTALLLSRAARDRKLELRILHNQGIVLENRNKLPEARAKFMEAVNFGSRYYSDQAPAEMGIYLVQVQLSLANLEFRKNLDLDRKVRQAGVRAAAASLAEARKLLPKLSASPEKSTLEREVRELGARVDQALPK